MERFRLRRQPQSRYGVEIIADLSHLPLAVSPPTSLIHFKESSIGYIVYIPVGDLACLIRGTSGCIGFSGRLSGTAERPEGMAFEAGRSGTVSVPDLADSSWASPAFPLI